jgi:hypothetical protein
VHCLLPLVLGGLVYLLFRPDVLFTNPMIYPPVSINNGLLKQALFTLPDFCWCYSFSSALYLCARLCKLDFKITALTIVLLLLFSEAIQLFFPQQFTFDLFDLAAAFAAFLLCTFRMSKRVYEKTS